MPDHLVGSLAYEPAFTRGTAPTRALANLTWSATMLLKVTRPTNDQVLTEREAAELSRFSPRTLQAWRQRNSGPPFIRVGRSVRYWQSAVIAWMQAQVSDPQIGLDDVVDRADIASDSASHVKPLFYDALRSRRALERSKSILRRVNYAAAAAVQP